MELSEARKSYDAAAKRLLSYKEVIANILKYAVREYKDCTMEEIISCLNGNPEIGTVPVEEEFPPKLDAAGSETVSEREGIRSFDIKFKVMLPSHEEAELNYQSGIAEQLLSRIHTGETRDILS